MVSAWRTLGLVACVTLVSGTAVSPKARDINGDWPVDFGTDCSLSNPCSDVHLDHWDRPTCMVRIQARQRKEPLFAEKYESNDEYFWRLPNGSLANTPEVMAVTLKGCEFFCGQGTWYWDAIPRLTTWIIPVVLLLSNIELSPIDKHRFMTVLHAVGDPIDSFWSLLHKIYVWRRLHAMGVDRCEPSLKELSWWKSTVLRWKGRKERWKRWWVRFFKRWARRLRRTAAQQRKWRGARAESRRQIRKGKGAVREGEDGGNGGGDGGGGDGGGSSSDPAKKEGQVDDEEEFDTSHDRARVIATVLAGFEEISGPFIETELRYTMVLNQLGKIGQKGTQSRRAWHEWRKCARMLADARTNEFLRTLLAIFIYIFGVLAALDDAIGGGNTSKPGGRIASAVFLMWLVPLALFSNVVGTFTSRRTCLTIMRLLVRNATVAMEEERKERAKAATSHDGLGQQNPQAEQEEAVPAQQGSPRQEQTAIGSPPARGAEGSLNMPSPAIAGGLSATLATEDGVVRSSMRPGSDSSLAGIAARGSIPGVIAPVDLLLSRSAKDKTGPSSSFLTPETRQWSRRSKSAGDNPRRNVSVSPGDEGSDAVELQQRQNRGRRQARRHQDSVDYSSVDPKAITNSSNFGAFERSSAGTSRSRSLLPAATAPNSNGSRVALDRWHTSHLYDFRFPKSEGGSSTAVASPMGDTGGVVPESQGQQQPFHTGGETALMRLESWDKYFSSLHWLGAVYTYRPWKIGYRSVHRKSAAHYAPNWFLYMLALFPVVVSAVGAFIIMWYAVPVGWSCRHVWIVGMTVAWLLSNLFTIWLHNDKIRAKDIHSNVIQDTDITGVAPLPRSTPVVPANSPNPASNPTTHGIGAAHPELAAPVAGNLSCGEDASPGRSLDGSDEGHGATSDGLPASTPPPSNLTSGPQHSASADPSAQTPTVSWWRRVYGPVGCVFASTWRWILGPGRWSEERRWYTLLVKDGIVGLGGLAIVFLSTSGVFNNCWCWSAYMWHRWLPGDWGREAVVPLNTDDEYSERAVTVYGRVVWACLIAQLVFFFGIIFLWWDGVSVVRWDESRKRREWRHEVLSPEDTSAGGKIKPYDKADYLLFWYDEHQFAAERMAHRHRRSTFTNPQGEQGGSTPAQQVAACTPPTGRPRSHSFLARNPQERTQTIKLERGE